MMQRLAIGYLNAMMTVFAGETLEQYQHRQEKRRELLKQQHDVNLQIAQRFAELGYRFSSQDEMTDAIRHHPRMQQVIACDRTLLGLIRANLVIQKNLLLTVQRRR